MKTRRRCFCSAWAGLWNSDSFFSPQHRVSWQFAAGLADRQAEKSAKLGLVSLFTSCFSICHPTLPREALRSSGTAESGGDAYGYSRARRRGLATSEIPKGKWERRLFTI